MTEKTYTEKQIIAWGQFNMMVGVIAITAAHFIILLFGATPFDLFWQGFMLLVFVLVGSIYRRQYQQTKKKEGVEVDSSKTFEQAHSEAVDKVTEQ